MALRSFAVFSVLVSAAVAQTTTSNPYIPSGISQGCTNYLTSLDDDAGFAACTSPFTTALAQFAPGASSPSVSSSAVSSILGQLCSSIASSSCSQSTITAQLGAFYAACENELTLSLNKQVESLYDMTYAIVPFGQAICAKDDNGKYCAAELSNSSSTGSVDIVDPERSNQQVLLSKYLVTSPGAPTRRDNSNTSVSALAPNMTTYQAANVVFMLLSPSMNNTELCTTCTRNILAPYITFESNCPYAPSLGNSLLFAGQSTLYNNITSKCGSSFLSGAVQAAGGISSGLMSGAASHMAGQELPAALGAVLGIAALLAGSL